MRIWRTGESWSSTSTPSESSQRSPCAPPWTQWFGDDNLLLIDVRGEGDGIYTWKVRVFEHFGDSAYRLHIEDIQEVAFPLEQIREALGRRFRRVRVFDAERSRPTTRSERLYFVCEA